MPSSKTAPTCDQFLMLTWEQCQATSRNPHFRPLYSVWTSKLRLALTFMVINLPVRYNPGKLAFASPYLHYICTLSSTPCTLPAFTTMRAAVKFTALICTHLAGSPAALVHGAARPADQTSRAHLFWV